MREQSANLLKQIAKINTHIYIYTKKKIEKIYGGQCPTIVLSLVIRKSHSSLLWTFLTKKKKKKRVFYGVSWLVFRKVVRSWIEISPIVWNLDISFKNTKMYQLNYKIFWQKNISIGFGHWTLSFVCVCVSIYIYIYI